MLARWLKLYEKWEITMFWPVAKIGWKWENSDVLDTAAGGI